MTYCRHTATPPSNQDASTQLEWTQQTPILLDRSGTKGVHNCFGTDPFPVFRAFSTSTYPTLFQYYELRLPHTLIYPQRL